MRAETATIGCCSSGSSKLARHRLHRRPLSLAVRPQLRPRQQGGEAARALRARPVAAAAAAAGSGDAPKEEKKSGLLAALTPLSDPEANTKLLALSTGELHRVGPGRGARQARLLSLSWRAS